MANRNVCPPDNDPPPCPVALMSIQQQISLQQEAPVSRNWGEVYQSPKKADVYLKLGQGKGSKLIKYDRSKKDKRGDYHYSLTKAQVNTVSKYRGTIEAIKIFLTPTRTVKDIKTLKIDQ